MFGLSSKGKEAIGGIVEDIFDKIALQFIGNIPKLRDKKRLIISHENNYGLTHLFIQALGNKALVPIEQDVLKSLLESSYGYIESLKNRTKSNLAERIDGIAREAKLQGRKLTREEVEEVLEEEMKKASHGLQTIVESEANKLKNLGTMMEISRVAASLGDEDPTVFFVIVRDATTCNECLKLHMMPDGVTPRLWKFSELKQGYHKRGEENASAFGLHPNCRCTLTYLTEGFGFTGEGKVTYHKEGHDEYIEQRE